MPPRSRRPVLESLESRHLLSVAAQPPAAVSALARPKTVQLSGAIVAAQSMSQGRPLGFQYVGSGKLGSLGVVQLNALFPIGRDSQSTVTLASARGSLEFSADRRLVGPTHLVLRGGTGAYTGWSGTGTLSVIPLQSGYAHIHPVKLSFKLTLKP